MATDNVLLRMLGLSEEDFGRLRATYLDNDEIVMYTRDGGFDIPLYEHVFETASKHPLYNGWEFDDDPTYIKFFFKFPSEYESELKAIEQDDSNGIDTTARWAGLSEELKSEGK